MRIQRAEESKARKAEEAARLAAENEAYYERINRTLARVDDDVTSSLELWCADK